MKNILISAIVAVLVAWGVFTFLEKHNQQAPLQSGNDVALDRVEKSGEIRCGYVNNPPFVSLDPNTHQVSGIMVDINNKIGAIVGWKIIWTSETSYGTMAQDVAQGKFDVFCGGSWSIAFSEKRQWWLGPLFYSGIGTYARADDERFGTDFNPKNLDNSQYTISVIDGVAVDRVRMLEFPQAHAVSLPIMSNYGDMILQVIDHKADVVLIEQEVANRYMAKNPGKIRRIGGDKPIRLYGMGYEFPFSSARLRNVFESAMHELVEGGDVDRILKNYEETPGTFYRVRPGAVSGN